jgi:hypothetical protein
MKVKFKDKLYPLQQEIAEHVAGNIKNADGGRYRFFTVSIGRQAGKSYMARTIALDRAINFGETVLWVAPTIGNSRGHWSELRERLEAAKIPCTIREAHREIFFPNGGKIYVKSAEQKDKIRGLSVNLIILDEAAFFDDGDYIWNSVLLPMITATSGVVLFLSTPCGLNWFYEIWKRGWKTDNRFYKSWQAPTSISPYQDPQLLAEIRSTVSDRKWREEFLAQFIDNSGSVFTGLDKACILQPSEPSADEQYVMGVDFGFNSDYTVVSILSKTTRKQVYGTRFIAESGQEAINTIVGLIAAWKPMKLVVERNGMGNVYIDLLKNQMRNGFVNEENEVVGIVGDHRVVVKTLHVSNELKREMVEGLAAAVEFGHISLLDDDEKVQGFGRDQGMELKNYRRKQMVGYYTYSAPDGEKDDTVSALYLANHALPRVKLPKWAENVKDKQETEAKIIRSPFRRRNARYYGEKD